MIHFVIIDNNLFLYFTVTLASLPESLEHQTQIVKRYEDIREPCSASECLMQRKDPRSLMILCNNCQKWYHIRCIGMTKEKALSLNMYKCENC